MANLTTNWYATWFNTDYYHILYKDRDYKEAKLFIKNLTDFLNLSEDAEVLDLGCGRGRHAIYLNKLGFNVTGADLSEKSIAYAKNFENEGLKFIEHDMTETLSDKFDAIFNLFTSFGYFESEADNLKTLKSIHAELKPNGAAVIDFMNVHKVKENLVEAETKTVNGIEFKINRKIEDNFIIKEIAFADQGETYFFEERVKALSLKDFKNYFKQAEINLKHVFGSYHLEEFDEKTSDRLILIFQ